MNKKFQCIVVDPPYGFKDKLLQSDVPRGASANYNTMSMLEIKQLPINTYADPDGAILALWVPSSLLQDGLDIMSAWGFKHKQTYIWVKTKKNPLSVFKKSLRKAALAAMKLSNLSGAVIKNELKSWAVALAERPIDFNDMLSFGMGRLFRQTHEICLIGINNTGIYKKLLNKSQRSVSFGENLRHSAKPEHLQDSLELMFPNTEKLELFARKVRPNWTCLGNEICNGEDIHDSLKKL